MSEEQITENTSSEVHSGEAGVIAGFFAVAFYMLAIALVAYGIYLGFKEPSYKDRIVVGDAYNYIIFSSRASIIIGSAIVAAIIGLGIQICGHFSRLSNGFVTKTEQKKI